MIRVYRYVLVTLLIGLIVWGIWYVVSLYNDEGTHEEGILVHVTASMQAEVYMKEAEMEHGAGNGIY